MECEQVLMNSFHNIAKASVLMKTSRNFPRWSKWLIKAWESNKGREWYAWVKCFAWKIVSYPTLRKTRLHQSIHDSQAESFVPFQPQSFCFLSHRSKTFPHRHEIAIFYVTRTWNITQVKLSQPLREWSCFHFHTLRISQMHKSSI